MSLFWLTALSFDHEACEQALSRSIYTEENSEVVWLVDEYLKTYRYIKSNPDEQCMLMHKLRFIEKLVQDYALHGNIRQVIEGFTS